MSDTIDQITTLECNETDVCVLASALAVFVDHLNEQATNAMTNGNIDAAEGFSLVIKYAERLRATVTGHENTPPA